ncbi:MAG: hypothetical protein WDW36_007321 [Sanguina aurantia]
MGVWTLTAIQREDVVSRTATNIFIISHSKGKEISEDAAHAAALSIEKKSYTAAEVAAVTTTGNRPASEVTNTYARKLSELLLEVIRSSGVTAEQGSSSQGLLDLTGSRDFLNHDGATEALQLMLAPGSAISQVRLSTKSFGREAAAVAAQAISNVLHCLTDADISDVIAGRPEEEALDVLRILSKALAACPLLKSLNLSDNALGEKGIRACAEVLTSLAALESLTVQNVGCSINACAALSQILLRCAALKQLHLFNNMSDNAGAELIAQILSRSPVMEDFRMASSRVGPQGGIALAAGLSAGFHLARLDLSDNPMTAAVAPALAQLIALQPGLTALNLNDASLGDRGVAAVAAAVAAGVPLLRELGLALNEVSPKGALAVAAAVASKRHLTKLNMRENELADLGCVLLAAAASRCTALTTLDFCGNQAHKVGAVALAKAAAGLPGIQLLALDENCISESGLEEVRGILSAAGKGAVLGPLEENEEEDADEDDDGEYEQSGRGGAMLAALEQAMSGLAVAP